MTQSTTNWPTRLIIILLLLVAFALRLRTLTTHPLWFDEAMEFWVATAPLSQLPTTVREALQDPPLYSFLLHFWQTLGHQTFILRLLSLYASLLTITLIYTLGRHLHTPTTGLLAAALWTILPPDIRFAQEVGQYAFLLLTATANLLTLSYARHTNQWRYWFVWFITAVLAVFTYYGSFLLLLGTSLSLLAENILTRQIHKIRRQLSAALLFTLTTTPLLLFWLPDQLLRGPTSNAFQFTLNPLTIELTNLLRSTQSLLAYQLIGYVPNPDLWAPPHLIAWLWFLALLLIALYICIRSPKCRYIFSWLLISWLIYYTAGRLGTYPYGGFRHSLILTPLLILVVAISLNHLWQFKPIISLTIFSIALITTFNTPPIPTEDLPTIITQYQQQQSNLPTYVYYNAVPAFRYHLQQQQPTLSDTSLPASWYRDCWANLPQPYCADNGIYYGRWLRRQTFPQQATEILTTINAPAQPTFWLIFSHTSPDHIQQLLAQLTTTHTIITTIEADGAAAYLLQQANTN
ncbi:MAG TPA: glycosyltransferase family 39 protein [Anaerolineae bacterium]|nr:glycosyltransferase family 39 protein [Anaerolineae bacterium]